MWVGLQRLVRTASWDMDFIFSGSGGAAQEEDGSNEVMEGINFIQNKADS